MKFSRAALLAAAATACVGQAPGGRQHHQPPLRQAPGDMFLIAMSPGKTRWVTEEGKWRLRQMGKAFMDITETRQLGARNRGTKTAVSFPKECVHQDEVKKLARKFDKSRMEDWLEHLSEFPTRFYKSHGPHGWRLVPGGRGGNRQGGGRLARSGRGELPARVAAAVHHR